MPTFLQSEYHPTTYSTPNPPPLHPQTIAEATNTRLDSASDWLDKARVLLAEARATLISLQLESERLLASQAAVEIRIDQMTEQLDEVAVLVRSAQQHATDLMMQVGRSAKAGPGGWRLLGRG